jgi:hypothetical protein
MLLIGTVTYKYINFFLHRLVYNQPIFIDLLRISFVKEPIFLIENKFSQRAYFYFLYIQVL